MSDLNKEINVNFDDKTRTFSVNYGEKETVKEILKFVYDSLTEKGYNPVNQIAGYVLSEDPTYITTYNYKYIIFVEIIDKKFFLELKYLYKWELFTKKIYKAFIYIISCFKFYTSYIFST